jgi:glutamyl-tRNA reductase
MFGLLRINLLQIMFVWGIILFHCRIYAFRIASTANSGGKTSSRCPFTRVKQLLASPSVLLANSLGLSEPSLMKMTAVSQLMTMNYHSHKYHNYCGRRDMSLDFSPTSSSHYYESFCHELGTKLHSTTMQQSSDTSVSSRKKKTNADALEVVVIGLSHHNAKVEVREKLAIPEHLWNEASTKLCEYESIHEAAVLSTCNRFEIYLAGSNPYEVIRDAMDYLIHRAGAQNLDQVTLRRNLFMLSGEDAIWHMLRVSAGLDSLVVGEGQILAQVKRAYEHGIETANPAGKVISRMLNTAISAGKRVRAETGISKGAVSISSAAAEFSAWKLPTDCKITTGIKDARIVIIGAGKMSRLLLIHLATQDVKKIVIVNRSKERVLELQKEFPDIEFEVYLMEELWNVLATADIVYPSTASETTIIDPEPLAAVMEQRAKLQATTTPSGLQLVDISVPRNVHPDCSNIPHVFSYNVDDLKAVVERNTAKRRREMLEAENILREELSKFRLWQQSLGAIPTIARLQEKAENLRKEELNKAMKKLSTLSPKDLETVEKVTKGIVAKLLHGPMNHLRQQQNEGGDATRAAIQQVSLAFQLEQ